MFARVSKSRPAQMTPQMAIERSAKSEVVVVDIREHGEVAASGKAKGAIHLPLATLRMQADPRSPECHPALKSGKPVVLYCASGGRATMAAQLMRQMGHDEVHNIGGFVHWVQAGGKVSR